MEMIMDAFFIIIGLAICVLLFGIFQNTKKEDELDDMMTNAMILNKLDQLIELSKRNKNL